MKIVWLIVSRWHNVDVECGEYLCAYLESFDGFYWAFLHLTRGGWNWAGEAAVGLVLLSVNVWWWSVCTCLQVFVGVVRFFAVAFALVVIVAETEWVPILRFWKVSIFMWLCLIFFLPGYCPAKLHVVYVLPVDVVANHSGTLLEAILLEINGFCQTHCRAVTKMKKTFSCNLFASRLSENFSNIGSFQVLDYSVGRGLLQVL